MLSLAIVNNVGAILNSYELEVPIMIDLRLSKHSVTSVPTDHPPGASMLDKQRSLPF
jgi:hypothetical protein